MGINLSSDILKVIPLGGLGEIGRNMMVLEYGDDIIVIDAGVSFVGPEFPGIDFAIPDIAYLVENKTKIRAILITHGHEDHIGALPYVLTELDVPVYSSRLTHGLITVKLREFGILTESRLNVVEPHRPFTTGNFRVEFFRVCHSIPDAMGIAITTSLGTVVHTGDFKIDHTPVDGKSTDFTALARIIPEGALLLLSDSTYAEMEGYTESEQVVGDALDRIIGSARGRVMVATFASLISRVQQVIDAAVKHGRKVSLVGRSMTNNINMALKMGYLTAPSGIIVRIKEALLLPHDEIVIVATGSQGEPTSALVRIANGEHKDISIIPGDTVVLSSSPIPGNETVVAETIDNLFRQGAEVVYSRIALVHVHGHASKEELKMMLNVTNPQFFVPVHGEYRHLIAHASIAESMGVSDLNTFVLEDGDVLEIGHYNGSIVDRVRSGKVLVAGRRRLLKPDDQLVKEQRELGKMGVIVVSATLDGKSGDVLKPVNIIQSGVLDVSQGKVFEKASKVATKSLEKHRNEHLELTELKSRLTKSVSEYFYAETKRRPTILTLIEQI